MTKAEVITLIDESLAQKVINAKTAQEKDAATLDKDQISEVLETFFDVIKDSMEEGENIYMRGFGSFINKKRARKIARHIKAKQSIVVEPHYIPSFKPAKVFTEKIKKSESLKKILEEEEKTA